MVMPATKDAVSAEMQLNTIPMTVKLRNVSTAGRPPG